MRLPIDDFKDKIIDTVRKNKVTVLVGETGSGKTTQLPVFFYEAGLINGGMLGVTQPRRIAAISVAEYVAGKLNSRMGEVVGYQVRFDDQSADRTKIKFMTDGILLREMQTDPSLSKYSVIMVDEAHERSQNIDFILGLLKDLLEKRDDLKVVVTSATIDQGKFSRYFGNAPIINVSGRTYPVKTIWSEHDYAEEEMVDAVVDTIINIHLDEAPGDVLVFMTGVDDINKVIEGVSRKKFTDLVLLPVHGNLDPEDQKKIFQIFPGKRKVVVATNIAETSITLDNTIYVVDSGLIKQSNYHVESGIQSLDMMEHSQAGCNQRMGRAGRTQPGICYRMYTSENYNYRQAFTTPEILRTSLASVVLMMESIGIDNIVDFDFIDQPDNAAFIEAYETLIAMGAIKRGQKGLTSLGESMADLPLEPRIARMVLEAQKYGCVEEVVTVAAFLSAKNVFVRPKDKEYLADRAHWSFKNPMSDALTFLSVWKDYKDANCSYAWCRENFLNAKALDEICKIRKQIINILRYRGIDISSDKNNSENIMRAVAMGLVYNLFICTSVFRGVGHQGVLRNVSNVFVHPGSSTFGDRGIRCFVAAKVVQTTKNYAHIVTLVLAEWLKDMVPHLCTFGYSKLEYSIESKDIVVATREVCINNTVVGVEKLHISVDEARAIQREQVMKAKSEGLVPLKFRAVGFDYLSKKYVSSYQGREISTWSSTTVMEGETYFCKTEDFLGELKAGPKFKVLEFSEKEDIKAPAPILVLKTEDKQLDLSALAKKWGRAK